MERLVSLVGLVVVLLVAWALSENRRKMNFRLIGSGLALQVLIAVTMLWTVAGQKVFLGAQVFMDRLIGFSNTGSKFLFGDLFSERVFALTVLPTLIFVAAATAVLFHLGVLQWVVKGMAWVMVRVMDTSGTESLAAAAEVFVGMTESPLVIRPYLESMTRSELMAMMTAGMGTVAGGVMAAYSQMGIPAGHLMTASLMAAPATLVIAKILVPETEPSTSKGTVRIEVPRTDVNVLDAACRGAGEGLRLALNVGAMLLAFIALIACVNWLMGAACEEINKQLARVCEWQLPILSLDTILGWLFAPFAWLLGIEWKDATQVGMLLGKKIVFNEFLAYQQLAELKDHLSPRSTMLATYALCGFANFGSVAIQIGGVGGLVPSRREVFARYGLRAMIGGALATFMTAAVVGILVGTPG
jgi:CNT family concentrative nucleoside transporter